MLFRKQDWYTQRLIEIPDRWTRDVVKTLTEQKSIPTYADVLRLRELTDAQLSGLIALSDMPMRTDQRDTSGLYTLLEIVAGSADRMQGPLFPGCTILPRNATLADFNEQNRLLVSVIDRISLTFSQLTPAQRALLPVFSDAQPNPLPTAGMDQFNVRLTRGEPYRGESRCRHVPIEVVWAWGETAASQFLCLPLSVPDDRADKTRIEAENR